MGGLKCLLCVQSSFIAPAVMQSRHTYVLQGLVVWLGALRQSLAPAVVSRTKSARRSAGLALRGRTARKALFGLWIALPVTFARTARSSLQNFLVLLAHLAMRRCCPHLPIALLAVLVVSVALRGSSVRQCLRAHARLCLFGVCVPVRCSNGWLFV